MKPGPKTNPELHSMAERYGCSPKTVRRYGFERLVLMT